MHQICAQPVDNGFRIDIERHSTGVLLVVETCSSTLESTRWCADERLVAGDLDLNGRLLIGDQSSFAAFTGGSCQNALR